MKATRLSIVLALGIAIASCGGNDTKQVDCDDGLKYQNLTVGQRVVAPEGLDQLDEFREMPIPEAAPEAPEPPPGKCEDMPPLIRPGS